LQGRESDVDAIEIGDYIEREEKREQALPDFGKRRSRIDCDFTPTRILPHHFEYSLDSAALRLPKLSAFIFPLSL